MYLVQEAKQTSISGLVGYVIQCKNAALDYNKISYLKTLAL